MRLFQAQHSLEGVSSAHYLASAGDGPDLTASRHDEQLLAVRIVPADPYEAWLAEREAERCASNVVEPAPRGPIRTGPPAPREAWLC